jgi:hypothetical protein
MIGNRRGTFVTYCDRFLVVSCVRDDNLPYSLRVADASWYWRCTLLGMCLGSPTTLMINRTRLAGTKKTHASVKTTYVVSAHPEASRISIRSKRLSRSTLQYPAALGRPPWRGKEGSEGRLSLGCRTSAGSFLNIPGTELCLILLLVFW